MKFLITLAFGASMPVALFALWMVQEERKETAWQRRARVPG